MFEIKTTLNSKANITELKQDCKSITDGEKNLLSNLANISSLIYYSLGDLNWCGFYLLDKEKNELVLGPFQGKPACLRIPYGKGVCGSAWKLKKTQRVDDVSQFHGHIACDANTKSELVVPLFDKEAFFGVLDLDSEILARFDSKLSEEISQLAADVIVPLFQRL